MLPGEAAADATGAPATITAVNADMTRHVAETRTRTVWDREPTSFNTAHLFRPTRAAQHLPDAPRL
jgi:hypothetical protein